MSGRNPLIDRIRETLHNRVKHGPAGLLAARNQGSARSQTFGNLTQLCPL